jgi:hypothetical protein
VSTDDAPRHQDVEELRQAASAIVALARVLSLPTTGDSERRCVIEAIERGPACRTKGRVRASVDFAPAAARLLVVHPDHALIAAAPFSCPRTC